MKRLMPLARLALKGGLVPLACLALTAGLTLWATDREPAEPGQEAALKLWNSLSKEQQTQAQRPFDDGERYREVFQPIRRPGLPVSQLSNEQKELLTRAIGDITTEYGAKRIARVADQERESGRYLTFYGTPEKGEPFAWRLSLHHLTVVYVEFGKEAAKEFGPILLGGNPAGDLWDEEDQLFLSLYASLSKDELGKVPEGVKVRELSAKPKQLAMKLLNKRLEVFNEGYRKNFDAQLERDGGADNLDLTIDARDASKSHHQGGRYYWRLAGEHVLCDWSVQGNEHLHLTLRASPAKKAG